MKKWVLSAAVASMVLSPVQFLRADEITEAPIINPLENPIQEDPMDQNAIAGNFFQIEKEPKRGKGSSESTTAATNNTWMKAGIAIGVVVVAAVAIVLVATLRGGGGEKGGGGGTPVTGGAHL